MKKFAGTKEYINLKNHHILGYQVYFLDARFQGSIARLPKWESCQFTRIYLGHSTFHTRSVTLVINPATACVSSQSHVVFNGEFYTVPFMTEGTIFPNWKYFVQYGSQNNAPENIDLRYNQFTPDHEEYHTETKRHDPIITPENKNQPLTSPQSKPHVPENLTIKEESICGVKNVPLQREL